MTISECHAHRVGIEYKKPTLGQRPIHVCFREKSGHRILSASSPFMTPNETSALDRRRPDRSRLRLHQALLQPSKSSAANSRMNLNLMGKSAWAAISQVSHTRRLRDP